MTVPYILFSVSMGIGLMNNLKAFKQLLLPPLIRHGSWKDSSQNSIKLDNSKHWSKKRWYKSNLYTHPNSCFIEKMLSYYFISSESCPQSRLLYTENPFRAAITPSKAITSSNCSSRLLHCPFRVAQQFLTSFNCRVCHSLPSTKWTKQQKLPSS